MNTGRNCSEVAVDGVADVEGVTAVVAVVVAVVVAAAWIAVVDGGDVVFAASSSCSWRILVSTRTSCSGVSVSVLEAH